MTHNNKTCEMKYLCAIKYLYWQPHSSIIWTCNNKTHIWPCHLQSKDLLRASDVFQNFIPSKDGSWTMIIWGTFFYFFPFIHISVIQTVLQQRNFLIGAKIKKRETNCNRWVIFIIFDSQGRKRSLFSLGSTARSKLLTSQTLLKQQQLLHPSIWLKLLRKLILKR